MIYFSWLDALWCCNLGMVHHVFWLDRWSNNSRRIIWWTNYVVSTYLLDSLCFLSFFFLLGYGVGAKAVRDKVMLALLGFACFVLLFMQKTTSVKCWTILSLDFVTQYGNYNTDKEKWNHTKNEIKSKLLQVNNKKWKQKDLVVV